MKDVNTPSDAATVATSLHARFDIAGDPTWRGPVPLSRILDEFNLLHVTLPTLTRSRIAEYLLGEGINPGALLETSEPSDILAGFIFTTGNDGVVFVSELEPTASEDSSNGQPPTFRPTPLGRRRFTAAHELGHFLLHQDRMFGGRWISDTKETIREADDAETIDMEREANRFAAELLMPVEVCRSRAEAFRMAYRTCPLTAFAYHLASELLVSPEAMRNRLSGLKVCDE